MMKDGRIVQQGTAYDLVTQPVDDYVARFVEEIDPASIPAPGGAA